MDLVNDGSDYINAYFDREYIIIIWINKCNKSWLLTKLRKIGDKLNQYVTSVRYMDCLKYSYDKCKVYLSDKYEDDKIIYSSCHSECETCIKYKKDIKENKIIGIKIYPKNQIAQTRAKRKEHWRQFF